MANYAWYSNVHRPFRYIHTQQNVNFAQQMDWQNGTALMYNRSPNTEDPWLGLWNHDTHTFVMYGGHSQWVIDNNYVGTSLTYAEGLDVFILGKSWMEKNTASVLLLNNVKALNLI